jgi:type I restriction enzyme R subunit
MEQARAHTEDQMMHGRYPKMLEEVLLDAMSDHEQLATKALENDDNLNALARLVLALIRESGPGEARK